MTQTEEQVEWEKGTEAVGRIRDCGHRMRRLNFTSEIEQFQMMSEKVQDVALGGGESK